jgi:hypothetical protein
MLLVAMMLLPHLAVAQVETADVWRQFSAKVPLGTELRVRLRNGQRFTATLVGATDDGLLLQPKTRIPVDLQRVGYDAIALLEQRRDSGLSAAKAAAIGVAAGAGAFLATMLIFIAAVDD